MVQSAPLPRSFVADQALLPIVRASSPVAQRVPTHLGFFLREGRLYGTDGLNALPLNPALMAYFAPLLEAGIEKFGRGSAVFLLSGEHFVRRMVVTDHTTFTSTIFRHPEAIGFLLARNFHRDESIPQP